MAALVGLVPAGCDRGGPPTPSGPPDVDRSNITVLDQRVNAALLTGTALPAWATKRAATVDRVGRQVQPACDAHLNTDRRIVTQAGATWTGADELPFLDEAAFAYDRPVASAAVTEARRAMTCTSYRSRHGKVEPRGTFDPSVPPSGSPVSASPAPPSTLGFCEQIDGAKSVVYRCTVLTGAADLLCSLRVWSAGLADAQQQARELMPAAGRACR